MSDYFANDFFPTDYFGEGYFGDEALAPVPIAVATGGRLVYSSVEEEPWTVIGKAHLAGRGWLVVEGDVTPGVTQEMMDELVLMLAASRARSSYEVAT